MKIYRWIYIGFSMAFESVIYCHFVVKLQTCGVCDNLLKSVGKF